MCVFASISSVMFAEDSGVTPGWSHWTGFVLSLFVATSLVWRHQFPWRVFAFAVAVPLVFDTDATAVLVALTAVLVSGGPSRLGLPRLLRSSAVRDSIAVGLAFVSCLVALTRDAARPAHMSVLSMQTTPAPGEPWVYGASPSWAPFLATLALVGAVTAIAFIRRSGRRASVAEEVRDRVSEQEQALREEMIRDQERTRIARDMHDTLAAALSKISLFAGGLQVGGAENPAKVASTAALIRETAHEAMADLRDIVGVLRGAGSGEYGPRHQGVEGIGGIVAGARAAGVSVRLVEEQAPGLVGVAAGQVAYRVVQEAVTNVQKHAPRERAEVIVSGDEMAGLRVQVANRLPAARGSAIGARSGLTGMAELAAQVGGRCSAGPRDQWWVVDCWLPWHG